MSNNHILHFTLGPVQGFIADARRLRDFWAGSFLLSLLSGHAMRAAQQHGEIIFPSVSGDDLFKALNGHGGTPFVGSLPNRFKASIPAENAASVGPACKAAVEAAWRALCDAVWDKYLAEAATQSAQGGTAAQQIWARQRDNFWDMAWVIGPDPEDGKDGAWLDQRKNWRTHISSQTEGGDHCRLMGQYQELSGFHRIGEVARQKAFWDRLREKTGSLDLQPDERLCTIALVKRLFPALVREHGSIAGLMEFCPDGDGLNIRHWPSTSYVAAVPWLDRIVSHEPDLSEPINGYLDAIGETLGAGHLGEWESPGMFGLAPSGTAGKFLRLDGHLLQADAISGLVKEHLGKDRKKEILQSSKTLRGHFGEISRATGTAASEFYAVLRMDGDGIGKKLGSHQDAIRDGLADFTKRIGRVFEPGPSNDLNGVLVYAGGDDVLAVLPAETAIKAAIRVQKEYIAAFEERTPDAAEFTLSGSIVYAHFKRSPLSLVMRQSEHYLDEIAKRQNGRSSLALAVLKPGGVICDWVSTFEDSEDRIQYLDGLAESELGSITDGGLAGGFFHGFQQKFERILVDASDDAFEDTEAMLVSLIASQLRTQFGGRFKDQTGLNEQAAKLAGLYRPVGRTPEGVPYTLPTVTFGAGLIARFLSKEVHLPPVESKTEKAT